MEDFWMSVTDLQKYLGITRDTVYKWIKVRDLPCHRVGRKWKFQKSEVDEWIKSGRAGDDA